MEKHSLPHGDRDHHDWEYLIALQAVDTALGKARDDKQERMNREAEAARRGRGGQGGRGRPLVHLNGPGVG